MNTPIAISKVILYSTLTLTAAFANAGTAMINGHGEAQAQPEFVTLSIGVSSECYTSAAEVSRANDAISNQVLNMLRTYVNSNIGDQLTASGGYVQRYTGYNQQTRQAVCVNRFKKDNLITLKLNNLQNFPQVFADLQDRIYGLGKSTPRDSVESATDFLEISTPIPGLTAATMKTLERVALNLALQDAKEKFEVTMNTAGVTKYHISRYSENQLVSHDPNEKLRRGIGEGTADPAPVQFGSMSVSMILYVEFTYDEQDLNFLRP